MLTSASVIISSWSRRLPWLLALTVQAGALAQSWEAGPGCRFKPLNVPPGGKTGFTLLPPQQTGIQFTNSLPEPRYLASQILPNGSGVAAGDIDGDGRCDLFFCGLGGGSRLYRNLGNWQFEDVTDRAGVACPNLEATGAVFADIDGDGDLDLIVNSIAGGTLVFFNDGQGHFTRSPQILNPGRGGMSLALADTTGRGALDLYIANYRAATLMDAPGTRFSINMINGKPAVTMINGRPPTDPEWTNRFLFKFQLGEAGRGKFSHEELGEPDLFCLNDGKGRFEPVSWTGGAFLDEGGQPIAQPPFDWGLSVMFRDFAGHGYPDLYVCNDFLSPDRFWFNDGRGRFRAAPPFAIRHTSLSSMAMDVADLNRDGFDDIFVVDMLSREHRRRLVQRSLMRADITAAAQSGDRPQYQRNMLFLNRGDGTYAEIAQYAGLEASEWSWAPIFLDVDLDGYEDLLVSTGFERDNMNLDIQNRIRQAKSGRPLPTKEELLLRRMFPRLATGPLAFRNRGGFRFEEVGRQWGLNASTVSQGSCLADLDNDGDLDLIVNNLNDAAGIFRNDGSAPRLAVRLKGLPPNTHGIGARITVTGGPVPQSQEMMCGGRYLSCDDSLRVFAAGSLTNRLRIDVTWRTGRQSVVTNAQPNYLYEIDEAGAAAPIDNTARATRRSGVVAPVFEDVSQRLGHVHADEPFDDFARQPLLPKRLSQLGPGVCWYDIDGDGWEDLLIGSGKGGQLACFHNDGKGGFQRLNELPWNAPVIRDQTTILGWGTGAVLVASANYEEGVAAGSAVETYRLGQEKFDQLAAGWESSVGPMALADYDGDGTLDVFLGGRVQPGAYPAPAASRLYRQVAGKLVLDEANSARLKNVGLVSGAVWSDLDSDGWPDLVLACEWGPVRVFHNARGVLEEITAQLGLDKFIGWWNGVTTGDLDGDGRLDIIASNWGQNTKYESHRQQPLRIYYRDPGPLGGPQLLEAYYDPLMTKYVPNRMIDVVAKAMPFLAEKFPTYQAWADTGIDDALGDRRDGFRSLDANWLESTLFLNRGNHFEARILPFEAQLAPAFAACVADYDGDGHEDVFLSQNFFAVEWETPRYDAGRGLWLQGDGQGSFRTVPGQESGIKVYGEQRGAAVGDYDHDGRVDLVVTQNSAETELFHNVQAKPGLRVRLQGPPGNPLGIGSVVRLKFGERFGPARELHAGSGYWSQDSAVLVLGQPTAATQIWVRWPGGRTTTTDLPAGTREIVLGADAKAQ
jgi:hypothetical protein